MEMRNFSPFPNLRFYNTDNHGREFGVALIKGTYIFEPDGALTIADEQAPLLLADRYHGALNASSLWLPSDLVPKKPRTDIILNAVARAPGGRPRPAWTCGVAVKGGAHSLSKRLQVTGPRWWRPLWRVSERALSGLSEGARSQMFEGWRLDEPEPVAEVPVRYEYAYGGLMARRQDESEEPRYDACHHNPIGCGWLDRECTPKDGPIRAPQIVDAEKPALTATQPARVVGFGPIPPAWLPRRPLGGTFDEHWRNTVWPNWPADYDFAYHNSAHPDLIYPGFLRGDETIVLDGFDGRDLPFQLALPGHHVTVRLTGEAVDDIAMDLDTLVLDVADADAAEHRAFLTWRATYDPSSVDGLTFILHELGAPADLPPDRSPAGHEAQPW